MANAGRSALIDSFQEFLERLSQEIEKDQLESLKFCLDEDIPGGILETCTTPRKLFRCMKQRGLLGKDNLDKLDHILKVAGRSDLSERIKHFKDHSGMEVDSGFPAVEICYFLFFGQRGNFNIQATTDSLLNSMSSVLSVEPGECRYIQYEEVAENWFRLKFELPNRRDLLDCLTQDAVKKALWLANCGIKAVRIGTDAEIYLQSPITRSMPASISAEPMQIQDKPSMDFPCLHDDKKLDVIVVVDCAASKPAIMGTLKTQLKHAVECLFRKSLHFRLALIGYQNHHLAVRKGNWHHTKSTAFVQNFTDDKAEMIQNIDNLKCLGDKRSYSGLADGLALAVRLSNSDDGDTTKCRREALKVCILLPLEVQSATLDIFKCTHGHDVMVLCKQLQRNSVTLYTVMRKTSKPEVATYLPVLSARNTELMVGFFTGLSLKTGGQFIYSKSVKLISQIISYVVEMDKSLERLFGTAHDIVVEEIKRSDGDVDTEELTVKVLEDLNRRLCHVKLLAIDESTIAPSSKLAKKFSWDDSMESACKTYQSEMEKIRKSLANTPGTPSDVNMEEVTEPKVQLLENQPITGEVSERVVRRVLVRREQNRPR